MFCYSLLVQGEGLQPHIAHLLNKVMRQPLDLDPKPLDPKPLDLDPKPLDLNPKPLDPKPLDLSP